MLNEYRILPHCRRRAFSVLELMVTLLIMALVLTAALTLLSSITEQSRAINDRMARQGTIQYCMARMMNDIATAGKNATITIAHDEHGWQTNSHVTIIPGDDELSRQLGRQIEWLAVPRYEKQDLVLFRREVLPSAKEDALYIPMCENLHSFDVGLLDDIGQRLDDPNRPTDVIEVVAEVYRVDGEHQDQLFSVRRTLCLQRF